MLEIRDEKGRLLESVTRLVDVSATGARFHSTLALVPGQRILARLRLLSAGVRDIAAHVVWAERAANFTLYGVAFDSTTPVK